MVIRETVVVHYHDHDFLQQPLFFCGCNVPTDVYSGFSESNKSLNIGYLRTIGLVSEQKTRSLTGYTE